MILVTKTSDQTRQRGVCVCVCVCVWHARISPPCASPKIVCRDFPEMSRPADGVDRGMCTSVAVRICTVSMGMFGQMDVCVCVFIKVCVCVCVCIY